ncbi:MAG: hypothetical protein GKS01_13595 [Alphaproteobacteria bacterium]|nr:hypothetical protein [Alphaproteobacteria bacterium]
MSKTAVFVATTEGPTRLQRLTAEAPDVRSVICLGGRAMALPISPDYDTFVRRPTGVIEACYGHSAYRMDISDPIGSGLSWQLGAFVGHALARERRLATNNETYNRVVWASGEVNCDLSVQSVSDIGQKLQRSRDLFDDLIADGTEIVIAIPAANRAEAEEEISRLTLTSPSKFKFVAAEDVLEVLKVLRLKRPRKRPQLAISLPKKTVGRKLRRASVVSASIAGIVAIVLNIGPTTKNAVTAADQNEATEGQPVSAVALETHAPAGGKCAEVLFDIVAPQISEKRIGGAQTDKSANLHRLCKLQYRIKNVSDTKQKLWVLAARESLSGTSFRTRAVASETTLAAEKTLSLDARPPRRLSYKLNQKHLVFAAAENDQGQRDRAAALFKQAAAAPNQPALNALVKQARIAGIPVMKIARHFHP